MPNHQGIVGGATFFAEYPDVDNSYKSMIAKIGYVFDFDKLVEGTSTLFCCYRGEGKPSYLPSLTLIGYLFEYIEAIYRVEKFKCRRVLRLKKYKRFSEMK